MTSLPLWSAQAPLPDDRRHRVLVVDGEAHNRANLASMLLPSFSVEEVSDGETAVRRALLGDIDIVLMDIRLHTDDGYEATRAIKKLSGDRLLPVLLMTANNDLEVLAKGLDAGADDFLITPVTRMVLEANRELAEETLAGHEVIREPFPLTVA